MENKELKNKIEAILFAAYEPVSASKISNVLNIKEKEVIRIINELNEEYKNNEKPYTIKEIGGGYLLLTLPEYGDVIGEVIGKKNIRLSKAALVTLAIISYKQPISKKEIDIIRGVDSSGPLETLIELELIKVVGEKDAPGRPLLYGTTKKFLEVFHLKDLKELPEIKDEDIPISFTGGNNIKKEG
uniref:SMC-Scp complex subunit ScpB n=1 Tax=candidate division WOR-3 bacterium TaxID=2052148 RepID=A0A7C4UBG8_UNCW3